MFAMTSVRRTVMAVVVTYLPEKAALQALLHSLLAQVEQVLIVDNTPAPDDRVHADIAGFQELFARLRLVRFGRNLGIAAALNTGIQTAIAENFEYVLLSDQDSLPAADMISELVSLAEHLRSANIQLAYVGAAYIDQATGHSFGFQVQEPGRFFYSTRASDRADPWVEVITGITSGSLCPCNVFADIGLMREDYFIDYVDTEWFHRARHRGYKLYGTPRAVLRHRLGDITFPVWYKRWRPFSGYSPQRLYFRFRNFVLLMRCNYVPWRWKVRASWYWLGNAYAYLLFSPNRLQNAKFIFRGLVDGLRGRTGALG
jgi:rhamnosyltransferase